MKSLLPASILPALIALALSGCGKSGSRSIASSSAPGPGASGFPGMEADLRRTLRQEPDFYVFKTPADFTRDTRGLKWDNGSDLPLFADPRAEKGGTLTEYLDDFPGTFRSIGPGSNDSFRVFLLDYVALDFLDFHPSRPGRYYPELAEAWAADPGTATVYFRLDPGARWSDGVPVTTDDVVFTFYFLRSPLLNDPWSNDFYTKTYRRLTIYDAHTFALTLRELKPDYIDRAGSVAPFPRHFFRDFGPGWTERYNWRICPTTGAYTIKPADIRRQVSVTLTHVPHWWAEDRRFMRGRYNPERIRLVVIHDPDKAFEEFVRGDLDIFGLTTQLWYDRLPDTAPTVARGYTVKATVYHQIPVPDFGLWLNESKPLLSDRNVRIGIQFATNFDLVCRDYFRGDATRQHTTSDGYGWNLNPSVRPRPFDPIRARAAFARAGFTRQGPDGILLDAQGRRLAFTVTNLYRRYEDLLTILKQEALKAGLEFDIETPDATTAWQKVQEKRHDIAFMAFSRTVEEYPRYWETYDGVNAYDVPYLPNGEPNPHRKPKPNTNNLTCTAIPRLDQLISQYDRATTMEEVKRLAAEMEQILWGDAAWVPGWKQPFYRLGYRPWIKWPADFAPMQALDYEQYWTMWIDSVEKKADLAAKARGQALPMQVRTYDRWKEP